MEEDKHLQLLDILGIPISNNKNTNQNIIFSHKESSIIYTYGSNIIRYDLKNNSKTFLQYFTTNIISVKYLRDNLNILIVISVGDPCPILSIWKIPSFQGIFSQELIINNEFEIDNIYIEQYNSSTLLILIINKDDNEHYLFVLNILNEEKFEINYFGKIKNILPKVIGFGSFYKSNDIAFLMNYNLQLFSIDLYKTQYSLKNNINFSFKLKENSLIISKITNFLSVLTEKGNCLIYDNNGINFSNINPIGQEIFTCSKFCEKVLCLGSSIGNIYIYNIYGFILKYIIKNEDILNIKNFSLINKVQYNKYNNDSNENNIINLASVDENNDQLFCIFKNNSFFLLSLNQLLDNTKYRYNIKPTKINTTSFFSFNHSNRICDICMKSYNSKNKNEIHQINKTKFYTCGQDNKLIIYNIDQETEKVKNLSYDLNNILSITKVTNNLSSYITSIKLHPLFSHKLYAGDNKGFLYIIYLNTDSNNKFKKYNIDSFGIIFLNFSSNGLFLFIGLETGKQLIYKTNKSLECVIKLNEHFISLDEIEFRKLNNHMLSYGYFFENRKHRHCLLYFKKDNILEYAKLFKNDNGTQIIKKKIMDIIFNYSILDLVMHKSENYVIVLDSRKQILIHNINENKLDAIIDMSSQMNKIYNIQIDISGLYLAVICDIKSKSNSNENEYINKKDLIIIEINTSKVKNLIINNSPMSKVAFDNYGKYLIIGGELGEISLWRLPGYISSNIRNILSEVKDNENFWDKYEIKYGKFLPYIRYTDNDLSLTTTYLNNYNVSNYLSSSINNKKEIKTTLDDSNFSNNCSNDYSYLDDVKLRKKHNISKSISYRINNRKNLNNDRDNDEYQNTNEFSKNKINNLKENGMPKEKLNYKFNNLNDDQKTRDYHRYNFWNNKDTIKIKNSLNFNGYSKHPEPKDIDAYLLK